MRHPATSQEPAAAIDRRAFLRAGAAFLLAFELPSSTAAADPAIAGIRRFNAFLEVGADNVVTAILAQTEAGQGASTGMPQVIAGELGAGWALTKYRFTTELLPEYINPMLYEGLVLTAGSSSITGFYDAMRKAAATTREMLVAAAAKELRVPVAE